MTLSLKRNFDPNFTEKRRDAPEARGERPWRQRCRRKIAHNLNCGDMKV
jgi:hypothetical protein